MAVTGDHRDIRDFINAVSEKYAESVWGPVFLPLRVRVPAPTGRLTGVRIDIKLLRLHPWARPELQIEYDQARRVWVYRCPVDGTVLTSATKDGLYELIAIHTRGHK